jgi:hypothetical protein
MVIKILLLRKWWCRKFVVITACNRLRQKQQALASSKSKFDVKPCMLMSYIIFCKQQDQGRPLPKFGEWDVNNPASAEGFTVIFSKARDEKKSGAAAGAGAASQRKTNSSQANSQCPPPVCNPVICHHRISINIIDTRTHAYFLTFHALLYISGSRRKGFAVSKTNGGFGG